MNTEPKMPPLTDEPMVALYLKWDATQGASHADLIRQTVALRDQQWAERVADLEQTLDFQSGSIEAVQRANERLAKKIAELERVLGVARDDIVLLSRLANIDHGPRASIATIDAARSKEGQHHD